MEIITQFFKIYDFYYYFCHYAHSANVFSLSTKWCSMKWQHTICDRDFVTWETDVSQSTSFNLPVVLPFFFKSDNMSQFHFKFLQTLPNYVDTYLCQGNSTYCHQKYMPLQHIWAPENCWVLSVVTCAKGQSVAVAIVWDVMHRWWKPRISNEHNYPIWIE